MTESELVPRGEYLAERPFRMSPIDRKFADLPPGQYFKLKETAEILGVSQAWLRRRLNKPGIKAPSLLLPQGDAAPAYVYTLDDIEELRAVKDEGMRKT